MRARTRKEKTLEIERNLVHLILGAGIALFILFAETKPAIIFLGVAIIAGLVLQQFAMRRIRMPIASFLLERMERRHVRPGKGAIHFFLGAFLSVAFFDSRTAFISVIVLAFCDSFSTIVGKLYGTHRVWRKKTFEGTLAGFTATFIACAFLMPLSSAALVSAAASVTEALSPIDDNISVPVVASIFIAATRITVIKA